jgi:hypothetical protein
MTSVMTCSVCGQRDCGLHDGVLAFAQIVNRCALIGVALLTGLIAAAVALAAV